MANNTYPVDFLSDNLRIQVNVMDAALAARRRAAAVPRLLVHLPQARAAADPRGLAAHRPPRADQRRLRHRQDRRHPARAGGAAPVRPALDLGHADQPLRPGRQLLAHRLPRASRADPALRRGRRDRGPRRSPTGAPAPRGASSSTSTTWRRRACTCWSTTTARSRSTSAPGADVTIKEIAETVAEVVGYEGETEWDTSKPDGTPQKLLDVSKLTATGWKARIGLREGLSSTVQWYREHVDSLRE